MFRCIVDPRRALAAAADAAAWCTVLSSVRFDRSSTLTSVLVHDVEYLINDQQRDAAASAADGGC